MNKINRQDMLILFERMSDKVRGMIINVLALLVNDQRYVAVPVIHRDEALRASLKIRRY